MVDFYRICSAYKIHFEKVLVVIFKMCILKHKISPATVLSYILNVWPHIFKKTTVKMPVNMIGTSQVPWE